MAVALVSHAVAQYSSASSGCTTSGIDTTGASLIVAVIVNYNAGTNPGTPTDSQSNTWTTRTTKVGSGIVDIREYYVASPVTNASHTFTAAAVSNGFASIAAAAFSGTDTATPYDSAETSAHGAAVASLSTGSITPNTSGALVFAAWSNETSGQPASPSYTNGFTQIDSVTDNGTTAFGLTTAWNTWTSGAISETLTFGGGSCEASAIITAYKPASGGAATRPVKMAGFWSGYAGESGGFAG